MGRTGNAGRRVWLTAVSLLMFVVAAPIPQAEASVLEVTRYDDPVADGCVSGVDCSLREAVIAANASPGEDGIVLEPGIYTLTGYERDLLEVSDTVGELFVIGAGPGVTTITKEPSTAGFFYIHSAAALHLEGISIVGNGDDGELSVAAWNVGGHVEVVNADLADHRSTRGGGLRNDSGAMFVTDTTITAGSSGFGGGVYNGDGFVVMTDVVLTGNSAHEGGGLYNDAGTINLSGGSIDGNFAASGAGVYNLSGEVTIEGTVIAGNALAGEGGGIYNTGILTMVGGSVTGNSALVGGGVYSDGLLTLDEGAVVAGNEAAFGGGIANEGDASLQGVSISGNTLDTSDGLGGGVLNVGTMEISASAITGNNDPAAPGEGGGIANFGQLSVTGSTVSANSAGFGGGITNAGVLVLGNSTVSGNTALGVGGGIELQSSSTAEISFTTITANDALVGGGVFSRTSTATIGATILAGNSASSEASDCWGALASTGFNLLGEVDGCAFGTDPGDQVGTASAPLDPRLEALIDNGGPTATHALLDGSPAADAVPLSACTVAVDQRGIVRPQGTACDVGAFESDEDFGPPEVDAALLPDGKVGPNDGIFAVSYACFDAFDPDPLVVATLNGVPVDDGQIVKMKRDKTFQVKTIKNDQLFLLGPYFTLEVTCTDASGNETTATAVHVFGA